MPGETTVLEETTTPVVFVHGTRSSSSIWEEQMAVLRGRGVHCQAVDLPGHGSRLTERLTMAGAVATIRDAVEAAPAPPLLVGLSLGGYSAIAYADRYPDSISGLMLSGCSTVPRRWAMDSYRRASGLVARLRRGGASTWGVVTDMLREVSAVSPLPTLRSLTVPVWFVNGRRDPLRLDERRFRAAMGNSRFHVLGNAGHDVHLHAPEAFNRLLVGALRTVDRIARGPLGGGSAA
ncbi:pimeloyl-ACP methyl ester carboxylesterase [Serinibacter salmoneus]|uniref:Pimeloyl-ACP methyl ester carboxylesterase n=1 Tax=Serinibacter salmoneus TaxID=556530 RepID=A0A2A9D4I9_9MICO|nr:pimeloyl-ACP methyl ester carboxylesterase [Serinibacter salmoneus]